MKCLILSIRGLHDCSVAPSVARSLRSIHGVCSVEVDPLARSAWVEHDEQACSISDMISAVSRAGCQVDGYTTP